MSGASLKLIDFLEKQQGIFFRRLYQQPSTALAIFRRMLPHMAKTFVMSMLFLSHPLPVSDLESWVRPDCRRERDKALSILDRLKILTTSSEKGKPLAYSLTKPFVESLRQALTGGGNHKSFGVPCNTPDQGRITIADLDEFARKQWEGLLSYMVGSAGGKYIEDTQTAISGSVKNLLRDGGLVSMRGKKVSITQDGFTFVLEEVNAQVWTILVYYLEASPQIKMDPGDVLSFFFQLGSLELGQDYSKTNLSPTQVQMLEDLNDFGLIYQSSPSSERFYPTRLATTLTSDANALRKSSVGFDNQLGSSDGQGFIVIETNYRLYAYTTSDLQIAILNLFARLTTRFPNLIAGKITRQSIRSAVDMGITADQIVSFLHTHAHAQMRKNNPVLPPSVVDQIRLWQIEGERYKATTGFLFKEFGTSSEHDDVCKYAADLGVLVWRNDQKRMCFVTEYQQIGAFMKTRTERRKAEKERERNGN